VYEAEVSIPTEVQQKKIPFEIKLGMSVTLYFSVYEVPGALALPLNAVNGKSLATVNLLKINDENAKVKLGDSYGNWVEVVSGLALGDKIKVPVFHNQQDKKRRSPLMIKSD
jgi:multidrug efflux pump subunit AcrA (membrane-fusion protein)